MLASPFTYVLTQCVWTEKALARLRVCAGLSEYWMPAYAISLKLPIFINLLIFTLISLRKYNLYVSPTSIHNMAGQQRLWRDCASEPSMTAYAIIFHDLAHIYSYFSTKTHFVCIHWTCLHEALLMRTTANVHGEVSKNEAIF